MNEVQHIFVDYINFFGLKLGYGIGYDWTTFTNILFQMVTVGALLVIFKRYTCRFVIAKTCVIVAWLYLEIEASLRYIYDPNNFFDLGEFCTALSVAWLVYRIFEDKR